MTDDELTFLQQICALDPEPCEVVAAVVQALQRDHNGQLLASLADLKQRYESQDAWLPALVDAIGGQRW